MRYYFVYMTINLITEDFYIGKHETENLHDGYLGSGLRLRNSIKKYGKQNFRRDVVEFYNCSHSAFEAEKQCVALYLDHPKCLNVAYGGRGFTSVSGKRASDIAILTGKIGPKYKTPEGKWRSSSASAKANKLKGTGLWGMTFEQRSKWNRESAIGRVWITNGTQDRHIKPGVDLEPGWYLGRSSNGSQYRKGMNCWNNGEINVFNFECPGPQFKPGMIKYTPTSKMPWWNNGVKNKRSFIQPEGFVAGRLPWTSKIVTCPFCNKEGGETAMKRHHFDNCKWGSNV